MSVRGQSGDTQSCWQELANEANSGAGVATITECSGAPMMLGCSGPTGVRHARSPPKIASMATACEQDRRSRRRWRSLNTAGCAPLRAGPGGAPCSEDVCPAANDDGAAFLPRISAVAPAGLSPDPFGGSGPARRPPNREEGRCGVHSYSNSGRIVKMFTLGLGPSRLGRLYEVDSRYESPDWA
jgi:hypothetical protein